MVMDFEDFSDMIIKLDEKGLIKLLSTLEIEGPYPLIRSEGRAIGLFCAYR